MADFIRVPSRIIDLSNIGIGEIVFAHHGVVIYWHNGENRALSALNASVLLDTLEQRYGVMTDSATRLWEEEDAIA